MQGRMVIWSYFPVRSLRRLDVHLPRGLGYRGVTDIALQLAIKKDDGNTKRGVL